MANPTRKQISDRIKLIGITLDPSCSPKLYREEIEYVLKSLEDLANRDRDQLNSPELGDKPLLYKIIAVLKTSEIIKKVSPQDLLYNAGLPLLFIHKIISYIDHCEPALFKDDNTLAKMIPELYREKMYYYYSEQMISDALILTIVPYIEYINKNIKKDEKLLDFIHELCLLLRSCTRYIEYKKIIIRIFATKKTNNILELMLERIKQGGKGVKEYKGLIRVILSKDKIDNKIIQKIFKESSPKDYYHLIKKAFLSYSTSVVANFNNLRVPINSKTLEYFIANNDLKCIINMLKFTKMFYFVDEKACVDKIKYLLFSENDEVKALIRDLVSDDNSLYVSFITKYMKLYPKIDQGNSALQYKLKKISLKKIIKEQKKINDTEIQQLMINTTKFILYPASLKEYVDVIKDIIPTKKMNVRCLQ